jgi:Protein of unknown function (DUF4058)
MYPWVVRSPFPGLDPYLEARWTDVHEGLIVYGRDALHASLPHDLRARVEQRVFVEAGSAPARTFVPDVEIGAYPPSRYEAYYLREGSGTAIAEPLLTLPEDEPSTEGYIEIRERNGGKVITVIEFLSPANKQGEGRRLYLQKQHEILGSDTNLVEIDLVRSGAHRIAFPEPLVPAAHRRDALAYVRCAWSSSARQLFAFPLRQRLPSIPVPLRKSDPPVSLDLQELLDQCYRNGRYDDIDYSRPPEPPLPPSDEAWADALLRASGKRANETAARAV